MNPWLEINNVLFTYLYTITTISETNHRTFNTWVVTLLFNC